MTDIPLHQIYHHAYKAERGNVQGYSFKPVMDKTYQRMNFIQFQAPAFQSQNLSGWKTHLSVHAEDTAHATGILLDIYRQHGGIAFKVATPETMEYFTNPAIGDQQAGKVFTLYDAGEKTWPTIINEIESRFSRAGIRSGCPVVEDMHVPGARYSYRRNDQDNSGKYVFAEVAREINPNNPANPYNKPDPLEGFKVEVHSRARPEHTAQPTPYSPPPSAPISLDAGSVYHDLRRSLGDTILGISMMHDINGLPEYTVTVPSTFPRENLKTAGVAVNGLARRKTENPQQHQIIIPFDRLPKDFQRDAAFFYNMERLLGKNILHANRVGNPTTLKYKIKVPETLSISNLSDLGIHLAQISQQPSSTPEVCEWVIPVKAAEKAGLTDLAYSKKSSEPTRPAPTNWGKVFSQFKR